MKVKQKSVRVFEIECDNISEFEAYLDKNSVLLSGFLILLKGDTKGVFAKECKKKGLCYASMGECDDTGLAFKKDIVIEKPIENIKEEVQPKVEIKSEEPKQKPSLSPAKTLMVTKNLRSGEDISTDADVTITGRINSGAKVKTNGNAIVLDVVDGDVEVWGDYVILKNIGKGTVSLKGVKIDKNSLNGKIKLATFDGKLAIKDI